MVKRRHTLASSSGPTSINLHRPVSGTCSRLDAKQLWSASKPDNGHSDLLGDVVSGAKSEANHSKFYDIIIVMRISPGIWIRPRISETDILIARKVTGGEGSPRKIDASEHCSASCSDTRP